MRRIGPVLLLAVLLATATLRAEEDGGAAAKRPAFPGAWRGTWTGPARAGPPPSGDRHSLTMELHVEPIDGRDAWTWTIVYTGGDGKRQERRYELLPVDPAKGHWKIDEKNSIVIDAWLVADTLYSRFSLGDKTLEAHYRADGDRMDVTLTTFGGVATKSGGEGGVPEIVAEKLLTVQRATLTRRR